MTYRFAIEHSPQAAQTDASRTLTCRSIRMRSATTGSRTAARTTTLAGNSSPICFRIAPIARSLHHLTPSSFRRASNDASNISSSGDAAGAVDTGLYITRIPPDGLRAPVALQRASKTFATSRRQPQAEFSAHNQYLPNSCIFNAPLTVMRGTGLSVFSQSAWSGA